MKIRKLPDQDNRVETGPIQFGDDWPGLFIRGDNAAYYAMMLRGILDSATTEDAVGLCIMETLIVELQSCNVRERGDVVIDRCDLCGEELVLDCPICGAPNCCPRCCNETRDEAYREFCEESRRSGLAHSHGKRGEG